MQTPDIHNTLQWSGMVLGHAEERTVPFHMLWTSTYLPAPALEGRVNRNSSVNLFSLSIFLIVLMTFIPQPFLFHAEEVEPLFGSCFPFFDYLCPFLEVFIDLELTNYIWHYSF